MYLNSLKEEVLDLTIQQKLSSNVIQSKFSVILKDFQDQFSIIAQLFFRIENSTI